MIVYGNLVGAASGGNSKKPPEFTYTGVYELILDEGVGWRIKFKTSGTFVLLKPDSLTIDAFLVGGGGSGGAGYSNGAGGGGGGGYITQSAITIYSNTKYSIAVGSGGNGYHDRDYDIPSTSGGTTKAFHSLEALGGEGGYSERRSGDQYFGGYGGKGSHNGGAGGNYSWDGPPTSGSNGVSSSVGEFGDPTAEKYAAGGGGGGGSTGHTGRAGGDGGTGGPNNKYGRGGSYTSTDGATNGYAPSNGIGGEGGEATINSSNSGSGGGGGGGYGGGGGGNGAGRSSSSTAKGFQGIVIIRNHREA